MTKLFAAFINFLDHENHLKTTSSKLPNHYTVVNNLTELGVSYYCMNIIMDLTSTVFPDKAGSYEESQELRADKSLNNVARPEISNRGDLLTRSSVHPASTKYEINGNKDRIAVNKTSANRKLTESSNSDATCFVGRKFSNQSTSGEFRVFTPEPIKTIFDEISSAEDAQPESDRFKTNHIDETNDKNNNTDRTFSNDSDNSDNSGTNTIVHFKPLLDSHVDNNVQYNRNKMLQILLDLDKKEQERKNAKIKRNIKCESNKHQNNSECDKSLSQERVVPENCVKSDIQATELVEIHSAADSSHSGNKIGTTKSKSSHHYRSPDRPSRHHDVFTRSVRQINADYKDHDEPVLIRSEIERIYGSTYDTRNFHKSETPKYYKGSKYSYSAGDISSPVDGRKYRVRSNSSNFDRSLRFVKSSSPSYHKSNYSLKQDDTNRSRGEHSKSKSPHSSFTDSNYSENENKYWSDTKSSSSDKKKFSCTDTSSSLNDVSFELNKKRRTDSHSHHDECKYAPTRLVNVCEFQHESSTSTIESSVSPRNTGADDLPTNIPNTFQSNSSADENATQISTKQQSRSVTCRFFSMLSKKSKITATQIEPVVPELHCKSSVAENHQNEISENTEVQNKNEIVKSGEAGRMLLNYSDTSHCANAINVIQQVPNQTQDFLNNSSPETNDEFQTYSNEFSSQSKPEILSDKISSTTSELLISQNFISSNSCNLDQSLQLDSSSRSRTILEPIIKSTNLVTDSIIEKSDNGVSATIETKEVKEVIHSDKETCFQACQIEKNSGCTKRLSDRCVSESIETQQFIETHEKCSSPVCHEHIEKVSDSTNRLSDHNASEDIRTKQFVRTQEESSTHVCREDNETNSVSTHRLSDHFTSEDIETKQFIQAQQESSATVCHEQTAKDSENTKRPSDRQECNHQQISGTKFMKISGKHSPVPINSTNDDSFYDSVSYDKVTESSVNNTGELKIISKYRSIVRKYLRKSKDLSVNKMVNSNKSLNNLTKEIFQKSKTLYKIKDNSVETKTIDKSLILHENTFLSSKLHPEHNNEKCCKNMISPKVPDIHLLLPKNISSSNSFDSLNNIEYSNIYCNRPPKVSEIAEEEIIQLQSSGSATNHETHLKNKQLVTFPVREPLFSIESPKNELISKTLNQNTMLPQHFSDEERNSVHSQLNFEPINPEDSSSSPKVTDHPCNLNIAKESDKSVFQVCTYKTSACEDMEDSNNEIKCQTILSENRKTLSPVVVIHSEGPSKCSTDFQRSLGSQKYLDSQVNESSSTIDGLVNEQKKCKSGNENEMGEKIIQPCESTRIEEQMWRPNNCCVDESIDEMNVCQDINFGATKMTSNYSETVPSENTMKLQQNEDNSEKKQYSNICHSIKEREFDCSNGTSQNGNGNIQEYNFSINNSEISPCKNENICAIDESNSNNLSETETHVDKLNVPELDSTESHDNFVKNSMDSTDLSVCELVDGPVEPLTLANEYNYIENEQEINNQKSYDFTRRVIEKIINDKELNPTESSKFTKLDNHVANIINMASVPYPVLNFGDTNQNGDVSFFSDPESIFTDNNETYFSPVFDYSSEVTICSSEVEDFHDSLNVVNIPTNDQKPSNSEIELNDVGQQEDLQTKPSADSPNFVECEQILDNTMLKMDESSKPKCTKSKKSSSRELKRQSQKSLTQIDTSRDADIESASEGSNDAEESNRTNSTKNSFTQFPAEELGEPSTGISKSSPKSASPAHRRQRKERRCHLNKIPIVDDDTCSEDDLIALMCEVSAKRHKEKKPSSSKKVKTNTKVRSELPKNEQTNLSENYSTGEILPEYVKPLPEIKKYALRNSEHLDQRQPKPVQYPSQQDIADRKIAVPLVRIEESMNSKSSHFLRSRGYIEIDNKNCNISNENKEQFQIKANEKENCLSTKNDHGNMKIILSLARSSGNSYSSSLRVGQDSSLRVGQDLKSEKIKFERDESKTTITKIDEAGACQAGHSRCISVVDLMSSPEILPDVDIENSNNFSNISSVTFDESIEHEMKLIKEKYGDCYREMKSSRLTIVSSNHDSYSEELRKKAVRTKKKLNSIISPQGHQKKYRTKKKNKTLQRIEKNCKENIINRLYFKRIAQERNKIEKSCSSLPITSFFSDEDNCDPLPKTDKQNSFKSDSQIICHSKMSDATKQDNQTKTEIISTKIDTHPPISKIVLRKSDCSKNRDFEFRPVKDTGSSNNAKRYKRRSIQSRSVQRRHSSHHESTEKYDNCSSIKKKSTCRTKSTEEIPKMRISPIKIMDCMTKQTVSSFNLQTHFNSGSEKNDNESDVLKDLTKHVENNVVASHEDLTDHVENNIVESHEDLTDHVENNIVESHEDLTDHLVNNIIKGHEDLTDHVGNIIVESHGDLTDHVENNMVESHEVLTDHVENNMAESNEVLTDHVENYNLESHEETHNSNEVEVVETNIIPEDSQCEISVKCGGKVIDNTEDSKTMISSNIVDISKDSEIMISNNIVDITKDYEMISDDTFDITKDSKMMISNNNLDIIEDSETMPSNNIVDISKDSDTMISNNIIAKDSKTVISNNIVVSTTSTSKDSVMIISKESNEPFVNQSHEPTTIEREILEPPVSTCEPVSEKNLPLVHNGADDRDSDDNNFIIDEAPCASQDSRPSSDGDRPVIDEAQCASQDSTPSSDGDRPVIDGAPSASQDSRPSSDGDRPVIDEAPSASQDSRQSSDGDRPVIYEAPCALSISVECNELKNTLFSNILGANQPVLGANQRISVENIEELLDKLEEDSNIYNYCSEKDDNVSNKKTRYEPKNNTTIKLSHIDEQMSVDALSNNISREYRVDNGNSISIAQISKNVPTSVTSPTTTVPDTNTDITETRMEINKSATSLSENCFKMSNMSAQTPKFGCSNSSTHEKKRKRIASFPTKRAKSRVRLPSDVKKTETLARSTPNKTPTMLNPSKNERLDTELPGYNWLEEKIHLRKQLIEPTLPNREVSSAGSPSKKNTPSIEHKKNHKMKTSVPQAAKVKTSIPSAIVRNNSMRNLSATKVAIDIPSPDCRGILQRAEMTSVAPYNTINSSSVYTNVDPLHPQLHASSNSGLISASPLVSPPNNILRNHLLHSAKPHLLNQKPSRIKMLQPVSLRLDPSSKRPNYFYLREEMRPVGHGKLPLGSQYQDHISRNSGYIGHGASDTSNNTPHYKPTTHFFAPNNSTFIHKHSNPQVTIAEPAGQLDTSPEDSLLTEETSIRRIPNLSLINNNHGPEFAKHTNSLEIRNQISTEQRKGQHHNQFSSFSQSFIDQQYHSNQYSSQIQEKSRLLNQNIQSQAELDKTRNYQTISKSPSQSHYDSRADSILHKMPNEQYYKKKEQYSLHNDPMKQSREYKNNIDNRINLHEFHKRSQLPEHSSSLTSLVIADSSTAIQSQQTHSQEKANVYNRDHSHMKCNSRLSQRHYEYFPHYDLIKDLNYHIHSTRRPPLLLGGPQTQLDEIATPNAQPDKSTMKSGSDNPYVAGQIFPKPIPHIQQEITARERPFVPQSLDTNQKNKNIDVPNFATSGKRGPIPNLVPLHSSSYLTQEAGYKQDVDNDLAFQSCYLREVLQLFRNKLGKNFDDNDTNTSNVEDSNSFSNLSGSKERQMEHTSDNISCTEHKTSSFDDQINKSSNENVLSSTIDDGTQSHFLLKTLQEIIEREKKLNATSPKLTTPEFPSGKLTEAVSLKQNETAIMDNHSKDYTVGKSVILEVEHETSCKFIETSEIVHLKDNKKINDKSWSGNSSDFCKENEEITDLTIDINDATRSKNGDQMTKINLTPVSANNVGNRITSDSLKQCSPPEKCQTNELNDKPEPELSPSSGILHVTEAVTNYKQDLPKDTASKLKENETDCRNKDYLDFEALKKELERTKKEVEELRSRQVELLNEKNKSEPCNQIKEVTVFDCSRDSGCSNDGSSINKTTKTNLNEVCMDNPQKSTKIHKPNEVEELGQNKVKNLSNVTSLHNDHRNFENIASTNNQDLEIVKFSSPNIVTITNECTSDESNKSDSSNLPSSELKPIASIETVFQSCSSCKLEFNSAAAAKEHVCKSLIIKVSTDSTIQTMEDDVTVEPKTLKRFSLPDDTVQCERDDGDTFRRLYPQLEILPISEYQATNNESGENEIPNAEKSSATITLIKPVNRNDSSRIPPKKRSKLIWSGECASPEIAEQLNSSDYFKKDKLEHSQMHDRRQLRFSHSKDLDSFGWAKQEEQIYVENTDANQSTQIEHHNEKSENVHKSKSPLRSPDKAQSYVSRNHFDSTKIDLELHQLQQQSKHNASNYIPNGTNNLNNELYTRTPSTLNENNGNETRGDEIKYNQCIVQSKETSVRLLQRPSSEPQKNFPSSVTENHARVSRPSSDPLIAFSNNNQAYDCQNLTTYLPKSNSSLVNTQPSTIGALHSLGMNDSRERRRIEDMKNINSKLSSVEPWNRNRKRKTSSDESLENEFFFRPSKELRTSTSPKNVSSVSQNVSSFVPTSITVNSPSVSALTVPTRPSLPFSEQLAYPPLNAKPSVLKHPLPIQPKAVRPSNLKPVAQFPKITEKREKIISTSHTSNQDKLVSVHPPQQSSHHQNLHRLFTDFPPRINLPQYQVYPYQNTHTQYNQHNLRPQHPNNHPNNQLQLQQLLQFAVEQRNQQNRDFQLQAAHQSSVTTQVPSTTHAPYLSTHGYPAPNSGGYQSKEATNSAYSQLGYARKELDNQSFPILCYLGKESAATNLTYQPLRYSSKESTQPINLSYPSVGYPNTQSTPPASQTYPPMRYPSKESTTPVNLTSPSVGYQSKESTAPVNRTSPSFE